MSFTITYSSQRDRATPSKPWFMWHMPGSSKNKVSQAETDLVP